MSAITYPANTQDQLCRYNINEQPILSRSQLNKLERLAISAPWQKLEKLFVSTSKHVGEPFHRPIFLMKLLVLQELYAIDMQQLRSHLGKHYSLFVFFIPGMENGLPKLSELDRLKRCMLEMNVLYPFLSECAEIMGVDRSKLDLFEYYNKDSNAIVEPHFLLGADALHSVGCPQCGRKNVRVAEQSLISRIFTNKKSYICNSCTFHFDL